MPIDELVLYIGQLNGKVEQSSMLLQRLSYRLTRMSIRVREGDSTPVMHREMVRLAAIADDLEQACQRANGGLFLLEKQLDTKEESES